MTRTIEVAGVTDELLALLDDRVSRGQAASRSEYIVSLLRRGLQAGEPDVPPREYTEDELDVLCVEAVKQVRRQRREERMAQDGASA